MTRPCPKCTALVAAASDGTHWCPECELCWFPWTAKDEWSRQNANQSPLPTRQGVTKKKGSHNYGK